MVLDANRPQSQISATNWLCIAGTYTNPKYYLQDMKKNCNFATK